MNILEAKVNFKDEKIVRIAVLVDFSSGKDYSDTRAIVATDRPQGGYLYIVPDENLNDKLIKQVADYGMEIDTEMEFPGWRKRYR
jgi:hypothetical protein